MSVKELDVLLFELQERQMRHGIKDSEMGNLRQLLEQLSPEFIENYRETLHNAVLKSRVPAFMKACEGVAFEISRLIDLQKAIGQANKREHSVSYEIRKEGKNIPNLEKLRYRAYAAPGQTPKEKVIKLENDVTLFRNGQPIIYDTKSYPARIYGESKQNQDQILKYQAAIEHGLVDAAVLEIRGRIDPKFVRWVWGSIIDNPSPVPDVQIIYAVPLPSGAEFRFDFKRCKEAGKSLPYYNDESRYTDEDRAVVGGLMRALRDPDKGIIFDLVSGTHIENPSEALREYLLPESELKPSYIEDIELHREYRDKRLQGLWAKAKALRQPIYNKENRLAATDELFSDRDRARKTVTEIVETYQQSLRTNPAMARAKASYVLGDPAKDPQKYNSTVERVVDFMMLNMASVREQQLAFTNSHHYAVTVARRKRMGWRGRPEGLALDVEHIMLDAIQEACKTGDKKGRSYKDPESRFLDFSKMMAELTPERDELKLSLSLF
jgi:hypothetical protein